jgi:hypothetical protein
MSSRYAGEDRIVSNEWDDDEGFVMNDEFTVQTAVDQQLQVLCDLLLELQTMKSEVFYFLH